jgi:RES domain-containing protein
MSIKQLGVDDSADFAKLVEQMHRLAAVAPMSIGASVDPGTTLYRRTNHHISVPTRIEELWYPPADRIRGFGRANSPGVSIFYCCSAPTGAFKELRIEIGQYAVLSEWTNIQKMILHEIGYSDKVLRRAGATRSLQRRHAKFARSLTPDVRRIRDFLELSFTEPTAKHYRITAAIAQMFLAADDIAGIMYPAVAKNADVDNLALLPEFVHSGLKLTNAQVLEVDTITRGDFLGNVIARLQSAENGTLVWDYTGSKSTTIPAHSVIAKLMHSGEKMRATGPGKIWIDGRTYDLEPGYSIQLVNNQVVVRDLQGSIVSPIE